jgi:TraM recognition site of TraD and TraG
MYQHVTEIPESERILIGRYADGAESGNVLTLPRPALSEHVYICGQTGSGKTSIGFLQLLIQLARPYKKARREPSTNRVLRDPSGRPVFDDLTKDTELWRQSRPPIVILDMKGDPLLFNTARAEAQRNGYPFRFFSIDGEKTSFFFNPLSNLQPRAPTEFCELLLNALDLEHGPGFGEGYYSGQHRTALLRAITTIKKEGVHVKDWGHLLQLIKATKKRKDGLEKFVRDATELVTVIYALSFFPQMLTGERMQADVDVIHMPRALEDRELVYFWLPTAEYSQGVREVGKLALYALHSAARTLYESGRGRQAYVFMDEAQHLAGRNFEKLLTQARGVGLSMILSSQYLDAFRFSKFDLRRSIMNSTRVKQYFSLSSKEELEEMLSLSGEHKETLKTITNSVSVTPSVLPSQVFDQVTYGYSEANREARTSRFERDTVRQVNMDPMHSLLWVTRDFGTGQLAGVPRLVRSTWPLSWADKVQRETFGAMPWPEQPAPPKVVKSEPKREAVKAKVEAIAEGEDSDDELEELFTALTGGGFGKDVDEVLREVASRGTKGGKVKAPRKEKPNQRGPIKTQDSIES